MNYSKLTFSHTDSKEFVLFWSCFYNYPLEKLYNKNIGKEQFSESDLAKLFKWKNGRNLSQKKQKLLQAIVDKLEIINRLKKEFCIESFLKEFKIVKGTIWKIFLLHIICPAKYPIFDQHVCRAFYFISQNKKQEIPIRKADIEKLYFQQYMAFFNNLLKYGITQKKLDEALWSFGKFLKTSYGKRI